MRPPRVRVHHIAIAVKDMAGARARFGMLLGKEASPVEEVPSEGVRVSFFDLGGCRIELIEAAGAESPVGKFLERRQAGLHHISLALEDGSIDDLFRDLSASGVPVVGDAPRAGSEGSRVFFVHPRGTGGVLVEYAQLGDQGRKKTE